MRTVRLVRGVSHCEYERDRSKQEERGHDEIDKGEAAHHD